MEYSEVPQLIDFFKSELPLRQERTQEYLCRSWSTNPYQADVLMGRAIADEEPEPSAGLLVDFFKTGEEVDAAVLNRSSSGVEDKRPMAKGRESAGEEQWSRPGALKLLSPTLTGTEESGTAAPKTPTCEMEIAYSRPDEHSTHQGSSGFHVEGSGKLLQKDHDHGQKRMKRVIPASIAPPSIRSEPLDQTPTSCFRDVFTQTQFDEETEAVVQAATSLLSLASNETLRRSTSSNENLRRSTPSDETLRRSTPSDLDSDEAERCSSVLSRPSNKRRYKLMADLLAECPRVQRRNAVVT